MNQIEIRSFNRELWPWGSNEKYIAILMEEKIEFSHIANVRWGFRDILGVEWDGIEDWEFLGGIPVEFTFEGTTYKGNFYIIKVTGKEHLLGKTMTWDIEMDIAVKNPTGGLSPVWVGYKDFPVGIGWSMLEDHVKELFRIIVEFWWKHTAPEKLAVGYAAAILSSLINALGAHYTGQSFMVIEAGEAPPETPGLDPDPVFASVDMPSDVRKDDIFDVEFVVENVGGTSPEAYLTVSFSDGLKVLDSNGVQRPPGSTIRHRDGYQVTSEDALVDYIETPFQEDNTRVYWARIQATETGDQWVAYRLCFDKPSGGYDWIYHPTEAESTDMDQQGWPVYKNPIWVIPEPVNVLFDVIASAPDEVIVGDEFPVRAYVESEGINNAHNVIASITLGTGLSLVSGEISQNLGDIPSGVEEFCEWIIRAAYTGSLSLSIDVFCDELAGYQDDETILVHEVPSLSCEITTSSKIPISSRLHVIAEVENTAETTIHNLLATLTYSSDFSLINPPDPVQEEEKLMVGETWTPNWLLEPTAADPNGWVQVDVSSETGPTGHDRRDVEVYAPQWEGRIIRNLTAKARSIAVGDVDGDGISDIVIGSSDAHPGNGYIHVFKSTGNLLWSYQPDGYSVMAVGVGDLDGDGYGDVVCGTGKGYAYGIRSNRTSPTTFLPVLLWSSSAVDNPSWWIEDVEVGDFDGDGKIDVASGSSGGTVCAFRGYDGSPFWPRKTHDGDISVVAVGDINSDEKDDIVIGVRDTTAPYDGALAYRGFDGALLFQFEDVETIRGALAVGDLDGDGDDEVVAGSMNTWTVYALKYSSPPNPTLLWSTYLHSAEIRCIDIDDLDGDGDNDVAVGTEYINGDNCVALDGSSGDVIWTIALGDEIPSIDIGDLDGNGLNDVVAGGDDINNDNLWVVNSTGSLFWNKSVDGETCKRGILVDDINADGMSDVVVAICEGNLYVLTTAVIDDMGPDAGLLSLYPDLCRVNPQLNATLTDAISEIAAAEYFIDSIGVEGSGVAMSPNDGSFDSQTEGVVATISISGLTDGLHTVYVHGIDTADNWGSFENCTFTVDRSPPQTEITDGPSGVIAYKGFFFRWTASDIFTDTQHLEYSYFLQGYDTVWSNWVHDTSKGYFDLPDGDHTFKVKARDEIGNTDSSPAERSFRIHTTGLGWVFNQKVVTTQSNQAYFIFADSLRMTRAVAAYDVTSGGVVYGVCTDEQNQGFDSNPDYVTQSGPEKGKLLLSNKTVLFFGGPSPHWCVSYYEDAGLTPAKGAWNDTHFMFLDQESAIITILSRTVIESGREDMFVIEVFQDTNGNTIFIFYGFDWKGTWAAGIYLHDFLIDQMLGLTNGYYVYHWVDESEDGVPQPEEINQEYPEPLEPD